MADPKLDQLCINTMRFLAVDAAQQANSGPPGTSMGATSLACWPTLRPWATCRRSGLPNPEPSGSTWTRTRRHLKEYTTRPRPLAAS